MAIRIHDADVTAAKNGRYTDRRAAEARQREVARLSRREKVVRHHRGIETKDLTPELVEEVTTKRAFVEALESKRSKRSPSRADMETAEKLRATTERQIALARKITNHIMMSRRGIMWGVSLKDIYREIAEILNESPEAVENAVDIAESMKLLRRQEADAMSVSEWVCVEHAAA